MSKQLSLYNCIPKPKRCTITTTTTTTTTTTISTGETEISMSMELLLSTIGQQLDAIGTEAKDVSSSCTFSSTSSSSSSTSPVIDISLTPHSAPIQPTNVAFPKRSYSDRGRLFNPSSFS